MPTKPTPLATPFSNTTNYAGTTGSPHPWSGSATKVPLSDGEIAAGWEPNYRPPAEKLNWLLWWLSNAVLYLLARVFDDDVEAFGFMTTIYPVWALSTSYAPGDRILQPSNGGIYECTVGGLSDDGTPGHTGPSGTGGAIVDHDATWKYVGYTGYRHGTMIANISPLDGTPNGAEGTPAHWGPDVSGGGFITSTGAGTWQIGIALPTLRRVTSVTFELFGDGVADLTGALWGRRRGDAPTSLHAISVTNPAAAWADVVLDISGTPWQFADGDVMTLQLTSSTFNLQVGVVRVAYDFLPL